MIVRMSGWTEGEMNLFMVVVGIYIEPPSKNFFQVLLSCLYHKCIMDVNILCMYMYVWMIG